MHEIEVTKMGGTIYP